MKRRHKKRVPSKRDAPTVALGAALFIGIILLVAAYGKLFYPAQFLVILERSISVIEILFLGAIFFFRKDWLTWLIAAVVFAAWFGYALFWYTLKLPCNCMGTLFSIPTAVLIILDFLLFALCMFVGYLLGAERKYLHLSLIGCLLMGFAGFAFAELVYHWFI
jgi:hypothetical protein